MATHGFIREQVGLSAVKLLKGLVARDGIEPLTPALVRAAYRSAEVVLESTNVTEG